MSQNKTETKRLLKRFFKSPTSFFGFVLLIFFIVVAILAPTICPPKEGADPFKIPMATWSSAPQAPSADHPFGIIGGRDIFYGVVWGTRAAFKIGLTVSLISALIGVIIGAISAYAGGWIDEIMMRVTDIFMSIPFLVAAMIMTTILGKGLGNVMIALIIFGWMRVARLIRGNILQAKTEQYVMAARALGINDGKIIFKHILPNTIFPVVIQITMRIGSLVITAAALSFLGVGAEPGYADWGTILSYSRNWMTELDKSWFAILYPGTAMILFVLAWNLVGDGLRDTFDPKMK